MHGPDTFETPQFIQRRVRVQVPIALAFSTLGVAFVAALLGMLAGLALGQSLSAGVIVAAVLFVLGLWPVCHMLWRKLDFHVRLDKGTVHVASGWRHVEWRVEDVDLVQASKSISRGHDFLLNEIKKRTMNTTEPVTWDVGWVRIEGRGIKRTVLMPPEEARRCGQTLAGVCRNALFIDPEGQQHQPASGLASFAGVRSLARQHRIFALWLAVGAFGALSLALLMQHDRMAGGGGQGVSFKHVGLVTGLGLAAAGAALAEWRKASKLLRSVTSLASAAAPPS